MDYSVYIFSIKEKLILFIQWLTICGILAFFFYRSLIAFVILMLFYPFFIRWRREAFKKKRRWELTLGFKEVVETVAGNLQAGNSVENAFRHAYGDLRTLYGEDADIIKELQVIGRGLDSNLVLEGLLLDLGKRSEVSDIMDFADIFAAAKRTGGNLKEIISDTAQTISEKIDMKRELRILISEKQFEQKIMSVIPFFILAYIGLTSPGYFDSLYGNLSGIAIMSGCLAAYVAAIIWGMKITAIEI